MSMAMLAVVLVLLASHFFPAAGQARRIGVGLAAWDRAVLGSTSIAGHSWVGVFLRVGLPTLVVAAVQLGLHGQGFGLPSLAFGVIVLFLCWGPRDLDRDVADALDDTRGEAQDEAAAALGLPDASQPWQRVGPALFRSAVSRWFGPLFWFIVLGPTGAVLFRLTRIAALSDQPADSAVRVCDRLLRWPVAQLICLALAVVGHFDKVATAWQGWHANRPWLSWQDEPGFLDVAVIASVDPGETVREEVEDALDDASEDGEASEREVDAVVAQKVRSAPHELALQASYRTLWRVLATWLVVLAVLLIAGVAG